MVKEENIKREEVRGIDTDILLADFEASTFFIQCPSCLQGYEIKELPYEKKCIICGHLLRVE